MISSIEANERDVEQPQMEDVGFSDIEIDRKNVTPGRQKHREKNEKGIRRWILMGVVAIVLILGIAAAAIGVALSSNGGDPVSKDLVDDQRNSETKDTPSEFANDWSPDLLSQDLLNKSINAIHMSRELYMENVSDIISGASVYFDDIDVALWVKQDDVCYVAFRATTPSVRDWMSNIPLLPPVSFQGSNGYWCRTQQGFFHSYFNVTYAKELRQKTELCVQSCLDGPCELVLTGGSQGGALAAIAAIDLYHLNPLLITFGQPKTLFDLPGEEPCHRAINTDRYLRFVNTIPGRSNRIPGRREFPVLKYDVIPQLPSFVQEEGEDALGNLILLDEERNNTTQLARYPSGIRDTVPAEQWDIPSHAMKLYRKRLRALQKRIFNETGVSLEGWTNGAVCSFDLECQADSVCYNQTCVSKDAVPDNEDQLPPELPCEGACQDKLEDGAFCIRDSNCQSGHCFIVCQISG